MAEAALAEAALAEAGASEGESPAASSFENIASFRVSRMWRILDARPLRSTPACVASFASVILMRRRRPLPWAPLSASNSAARNSAAASWIERLFAPAASHRFCIGVLMLFRKRLWKSSHSFLATLASDGSQPKATESFSSAPFEPAGAPGAARDEAPPPAEPSSVVADAKAASKACLRTHAALTSAERCSLTPKCRAAISTATAVWLCAWRASPLSLSCRASSDALRSTRAAEARPRLCTRALTSISGRRAAAAAAAAGAGADGRPAKSGKGAGPGARGARARCVGRVCVHSVHILPAGSGSRNDPPRHPQR